MIALWMTETWRCRIFMLAAAVSAQHVARAETRWQNRGLPAASVNCCDSYHLSLLSCEPIDSGPMKQGVQLSSDESSDGGEGS